MDTTTAMPTVLRKRYYSDDGTRNSELNSLELETHLHGAYTFWVHGNCLEHDFSQACAHTAEGIYIDYLMIQSPVGGFSELELQPVPVLLAPYREPSSAGQANRFYDETNSLSLAIDTTRLRLILVPLFLKWVMAGWHARDFVQLVRDTATVLTYDHHLAQSLGGLGGGMTGKEFLTSPYKP